MSCIGLVIRPGVEAALVKARELIEWAAKNKHEVIIESGSAAELKLKDGKSAEHLVSHCDPIVALGGDGTLIGVARHVSKKSPVLLGINFGRLGFLTEVAPDELFTVLQSVLDGKAETGKCEIMKCEVIRDGQRKFISQAVNDGVIHKGVLDKLMDLDISVDGETVLRLRADGVIISTPTGSTAYSLASGGPIVHPELSALLVTPICAHLLTVRPFIVPLSAKIKVTLPAYDGQCFLSVDGQVGFDMHVGDVVEFSHSDHNVKFVRSPSKSYFEILRRKFSWGQGINEG